MNQKTSAEKTIKNCCLFNKQRKMKRELIVLYQEEKNYIKLNTINDVMNVDSFRFLHTDFFEHIFHHRIGILNSFSGKCKH